MRKLLIFLSIIIILGCKEYKEYHHEWDIVVEYFNGDTDTLTIEHDAITTTGRYNSVLILQTTAKRGFGAAEVPSCVSIADGFYRLTQVCNVRRFTVLEHRYGSN